jgi:hypothetical protein
MPRWTVPISAVAVLALTGIDARPQQPPPQPPPGACAGEAWHLQYDNREPEDSPKRGQVWLSQFWVPSTSGCAVDNFHVRILAASATPAGDPPRYFAETDGFVTVVNRIPPGKNAPRDEQGTVTFIYKHCNGEDYGTECKKHPQVYGVFQAIEGRQSPDSSKKVGKMADQQYPVECAVTDGLRIESHDGRDSFGGDVHCFWHGRDVGAYHFRGWKSDPGTVGKSP